MITYEEVLFLAGKLVAFADLHAPSRDDVIDLCLRAGYLRGLVDAGEPVDSHRFTSTYDAATAALNALGGYPNDRVHPVPVEQLPVDNL